CHSPASSQMIRVWRLSGQQLAACSAEEFTDAAALKEHLCKLCGFPVYLQQLLQDGNALGDGAELDAPMDLQVVLLTIPCPGISSLSSNGNNISLLAEADLLDAARRNCDKMVRCLLAAGVEKDIRDDVDGMTALMLASESGHFEVARLLLEAGAEKECSDDDGWTALMLASDNGHLEIARLLVEDGADKARQAHFETALILASEPWRRNDPDNLGPYTLIP
ncbi:RIPK4, partial [Symbiodinium microadriaticum]